MGLNSSISWSTLAPFARSLSVLALEAAILVGWPVGWAIATHRLVERGEATVLATLGESPTRTLRRLGRQGIVFALLLAASSAVLGREAAAPGRVVNALLSRGRAACRDASSPSTFGVPFVSATWLCAPNQAPPRIVGRAPIGRVAFTASDARVSDDLRRIDLDDARLALPLDGASALRIHVSSLRLSGLSPWTRASAVGPALRAVVVALSGVLAASSSVLALLLLAGKQRKQGIVVAVAIGAAGPLAALATLRATELRLPEGETANLGWKVAVALTPFSAVIAVLLIAALLLVLPERRVAGSK